VHGGLERASASTACLLAAWRSAARASHIHDQKTAHNLAWLTTTLPSCIAQPWRSQTTTPSHGRTSLASCSSSGGKHRSGRPRIPCEFFTSGKPRRPSSSQGEIPPTPSSLSFVDHPHAQTRVCLCCCATVLRRCVLWCASVRFVSLVRRAPRTASAKPSPAQPACAASVPVGEAPACGSGRPDPRRRDLVVSPRPGAAGLPAWRRDQPTLLLSCLVPLVARAN
jgi:hypothetical protein